jgi:hypothetical protein
LALRLSAADTGFCTLLFLLLLLSLVFGDIWDSYAFGLKINKYRNNNRAKNFFDPYDDTRFCYLTLQFVNSFLIKYFSFVRCRTDVKACI